MAINVNEVYQTVLLILNKEQRGYITPNEFNKLATQVQQEIFEQYFEDLNQYLRQPGYQDEYADRVDNIEEKIALFKTFASVPYYSATPTGPIDNPYFYLPEDTHRIGTIMYKDEQQVQGTDRREFLHLNMSKLTRPSTNYPLYIQEGTVSPEDPLNPGTFLCNECIRVYVYPPVINSQISLSYIKKPKDVVWAYGVGSLGQYVWDGTPGFSLAPVIPTTGSVDFEISNQDKIEVIIRILMYAGVVIRDPQIVQAAASQAASIEQTQKT